jgi:hypothetical protein
MMGSRKGGVAIKPPQLLRFAQMDYRGLEDLLTSSAKLRVALGLESVPDHSTFHWFMATTLRLFRRRSRRGDGSRGCHGLFPVSGQPLLHETSSEAVPDVVDGRVGPTPGHLCPEGLGRSREPVSVASAVGPGDGASWSRPASVALCRLRFRADSSTAPGGAGYREHHPGHGVLSWTGPDPLPASDATLFPPPEIRSAVDRRDGRFGPQAEIWRCPDDPPLVAIGHVGFPAGLGLQPSSDRCGGGDLFASLGSLPPPRGATDVRNAYGIPTPMRFFDRASEAYLRS